jgi:hypothetical protein
MACTQIGTQIIWRLNFYSYICGVNQIYKYYADNYNA